MLACARFTFHAAAMPSPRCRAQPALIEEQLRRKRRFAARARYADAMTLPRTALPLRARQRVSVMRKRCARFSMPMFRLCRR